MKAHERLDALTKGGSKIVASETQSHVMIEASEMRDFLLGMRHSLVIQLSALDKVLKLDRKGCGNGL